MTDKRQSVSELIQGGVVLAVMVGGLGWLVVAAFRSGNPWFIGAVIAFLLAPLGFAGAFIAMMMTAQWLDKRRCAREGRPWQP